MALAAPVPAHAAALPAAASARPQAGAKRAEAPPPRGDAAGRWPAAHAPLLPSGPDARGPAPEQTPEGMLLLQPPAWALDGPPAMGRARPWMAPAPWAGAGAPVGTAALWRLPAGGEAILQGQLGGSHRLFAAAMYRRRPQGRGAWTTEATARASRALVGHFWGLGPHSTRAGHSSFARAHGHVGVRRGLNVLRGRLGLLNVGLRSVANHDVMYGAGIPTVPATSRRHPRVPGARGAPWMVGQFIEARLDGREGGPIPRHGLWAELALGLIWGLSDSPSYVDVRLDAHRLLLHSHRATTAARLHARWVSSPSVPFYQQTSLGGAHLLRGHLEGRFVDQGAWTLELEERVRIGSHGHVAWHLDPFAAVGQVFSGPSQLLAAPRPTVGVGLRAVVRPHRVTRLDVATDFHQVRAYLDVGYPF